MIDYHCHILPQFDDGSRSVEMSLDMIRLMRQQGVERIIATPHFYAHTEENVEKYLIRRQQAYERLVEADPANAAVQLGSEVAIEHGLSRLRGIEKLCMGSSGYILLELPYTSYAHWRLEEIQEISFETGLIPIIAHINRYLDFYTKSELENILSLKAVFQLNIEAFEDRRQKKFVKKLVKDGYPYIFGSDAHNMSSRRPNWDLLKAKAKPDMIAGAEVLI